MNIYQNFADFQDVTYSIAGNNLSYSKVESIKVYANNTAYIDKKKVDLSEADINTIEVAMCEFFITQVLNRVKSKEIFYKNGKFMTELSMFSLKFETTKEAELSAKLKEAGVTVTHI